MHRTQTVANREGAQARRRVTGSKIAMLHDTCGNLIQVTQLMRW